ncbi:MAG: radical SAM protein [Alphaproteobacteria bacterium]|nr:radical SAM protein [Alphaproteobacteria bacterium]
MQDGLWPAGRRAARLNGGKFADAQTTANGETRASVTLARLETLWINTGTLCNLSCASCYIESTPRNDRLAYMSRAEVRAYLDEIAQQQLGTQTIGVTGGEPFMNPDIAGILEDALAGGFETIVLTNAMKPMRRFEKQLLALNTRFPGKLTMRVSLDHYTRELHELERGPRSWQPTIDGMVWLARNGFTMHAAGRMYTGEGESVMRAGYQKLMQELGIALDCADHVKLVLFPEMDETIDVPEITESCWGILGKSPADIMCSSSRMIVKRKGAERPAVLACTLVAYDPQFELGETLAQARKSVALNHPHCAKFCVLGGAACSR